MPNLLLSSLPLAAIAAAALTPPSRPAAPAKVSLDLATLHAAALISPRPSGAETDAPYLLVSIANGPAGQGSKLPATGHWTIHQDQALGQTPITTLELKPGENVKVLLSVLEDHDALADESATATSASLQLASKGATTDVVTAAISGLTSRGAHLLGSATLVISNVNGKVTWNSLDCVATCKVLRGPGAGADVGAAAVSGVVQLEGSGATYHMQVAVSSKP